MLYAGLIFVVAFVAYIIVINVIKRDESKAAGVIQISSAEELARIGVADNYPMDGDYDVKCVKARFDSYAEVGRPLKVIIDNKDSNITYTYKWKVKGAYNNSDTYIPVEEDLESYISVEVIAEETQMRWKLSTYMSELPVIYINTDDGNEVTSNYTEKAADIIVQGNCDCDNAKYLYNGRTTIKGRGNSTWATAVDMGVKKPYKLKLAEKANLLGLGENGRNKHWVLLANMIDHTNMRNEITQNFSKDMGMRCAMGSTAVVHYSDLFDVDSLVNNWFVCELTNN